ncbi:MAG: hypothetical protein ACRBBN_08485 [Methyloligellaceae bacterium]
MLRSLWGTSLKAGGNVINCQPVPEVSSYHFVQNDQTRQLWPFRYHRGPLPGVREEKTAG